MQETSVNTELQLISIKIAAAMSNVTPKTFARWESLGLTPASIHIGKTKAKTKRYRKADIELWVDLGCPPREEFEARMRGGAA